MPNSFRPQMEKIGSPFVPGFVVTPFDFWVCMEGGQEVENPPPPPLFLPSMHVYIPSLPPLPLTDHWALFLPGHSKHFQPIRVDSRGVGGREWPFMERREEVVVVGGRGRGTLWPLCHGMCVHSHHLLATNTHTHTHKGMQTHTHTHTHTRLLPCA